MKTVVIVQARLGSQRLPGKMLLPLNGNTVIGEVLHRCWQIPGIDVVCCAIPEGPENEPLEREATQYCRVYKSSEDDVLERYWWAAICSRSDIIVRITGDCPLLSPKLCGEVLALLKRENADYASNIEPRTFPKGLDCEVFTLKTLQRACENARADEREHVTTWMRRAGIKRVNFASPYPMDGRLTLDTRDDYNVIRAAFDDQATERLRAA